MILFYSKDTGEIIGVIDGRITTDSQMAMQIGDPGSTEKLVVQWVDSQWYNEKGEKVSKDDPSAYTADYAPEHPQKELFIGFDNNSLSPYDYKVTPDGSLIHI